MLKTILTILSALSSLAAAILWLLSSRVKIPKENPVIYVMPGTNLGAPTDDDLPVALVKQSKLSAWAALFAFISATTQSILFCLPEHY